MLVRDSLVLLPFNVSAAAAYRAVCAGMHLDRKALAWPFQELHHRTGTAHDSLKE